MLGGGEDQRLDLFRRVRGALRQGAHFGGDDRKAAAGFACPRRFDAGVERQEVGLEGDLVDHADDLGDLARGALDLAHGGDRLADHFARTFGLALCFGDDRVGLARAVGGLADRGGDLVERRGGFFEGRGLLFGAARQVVGRVGDLVGARADALHVGDDDFHRILQLRHGRVEITAQGLVLGREGRLDVAGQVAVREQRELRAERCDHHGQLVGCSLGFRLEAPRVPAARA